MRCSLGASSGASEFEVARRLDAKWGCGRIEAPLHGARAGNVCCDPGGSHARVNGDLRLLRRRWWGSWAVLAMALFSLAVIALTANLPSNGTPGLNWRTTLATAAIVLPLVLVSYAPWTFFSVLRVCGLLAFVSCIAFLVSEIRGGHTSADSNGTMSALRAVLALFLFGRPGLWLALLRRPQICPYDESGRRRPFEIERTFRLIPLNPDTQQPTDAARVRKRRVNFDYAGPSKMEILTREPPLLRVTLPMDRTGDAVWEDWQRRLAESDLRCEVTQDQPGSRSFKDSVVQSIDTRLTPGRRVKSRPDENVPPNPS